MKINVLNYHYSRGREPEGMWNLLSIVREMYRRDDRNGIPLLEIVTQQCLETTQVRRGDKRISETRF